MLSNAQREVAVHLLANAIRQKNLHAKPAPQSEVEAGTVSALRIAPRNRDDDAYLRGMFDMLRGLCGATYAEELFRAARTLERFPSGS